MISMPKGTKDVKPSDSYKWHYLENLIREITALYACKEIRTPTFESTDLFVRGVGDTTDVVNKEMYTFLDKGGQSMTLKPEGTAGVARSFVENSIYAGPQPSKMFYLTPVFRYEKPQKGRLREHHQFGVEIFGSYLPSADVEVIQIALELFNRIGLKNLELNINSIGCECCRPKYNQALREYYKGHLSSMCSTCRDRYQKNPLRMLDCKVDGCIEINKKAPVMLDYLCDDCQAHHEQVIKYLDNLRIPYKINPYIVRGLDYYTRTVFEFVSTDIGAQGTVCGGGRYNNLVKEIADIDTPAVGFGMGLERLIITMETLGLSFGEEPCPIVYLGNFGEAAKLKVQELVAKLRSNGILVEHDLMDRSIKAQMKYANKIGAKFSVVIGDTEIAENKVELKNMQTGEVILVSPLENMIEVLKEKKVK